MSQTNHKVTPKVSIVIPVYNGANYLRDALDSALNQTYTNIEIVVINDGSNDNNATEEIALSYGDKIRYFKKPNGGVASALNYGISKMSGDYFSWLSHDDLYTNDKIEQQINFLFTLKDSSNAIVYSDFSVFTSDPNISRRIFINKIHPKAFGFHLAKENNIHGCTLLIPKKAFEELGIFDEKLRITQDYDLWFKMAQKYEFHHIKADLVKARSHPQQDTITLNTKVKSDSDFLITKFILGLTDQELKLGNNSSPCCAYAILAICSYRKGFYNAANTARKLALNQIKQITTKECLLILLCLTKAIIRKNAKTTIMIFKYYFQKIKQFLEIKKLALQKLSLEDKFTKVYFQNLFNSKLSRSGEGSNLHQTRVIQQELPNLFNEFNIKTVVDAPCGDWFWMSKVDLSKVNYLGVDIVKPVIENNNKQYSKENISFNHIDITSDNVLIPKSDLIFSRDCFVHLSYNDIIKAIKHFKKSGAKYLLTTTFVAHKINQDLNSKFWRPINFQNSPFNFPQPIKIINEGCTEDNNNFNDKCLGLWKLEDIII